MTNAHRESFAKQTDKLEAHLRSASLPIKQGRLYRAAALRVLKKMSHESLLRLEDNLTSYYFYPDLNAVGATTGNRPDALAFYRASNGSLHLDGGEKGDTIHDIYAHEYTHALDGPDDEISGTAGWKAAWQEEIVEEEGLGGAGLESPAEGLASFGELMLRGRREAAMSKCPKCVAFWEDLGQ